MQAKEVLLVLTDHWADWEAAYATSGINLVPQYEMKTISVDKVAKVSIGGIRAEIDYTIDVYDDFSNTAMVILTGGFAWGEGQHDEIANFVKKAINSQIPVAAICGATIFLGRHGFLDKTKHTGDELELFQEADGYNGKDFYVSAQVVTDGGFITANETAALEFAHAIFKVLKIREDNDIDDWYGYFKKGMVQ